MILQPELLLSGKCGVSGPNAFPLVARGPKLGPEHVMDHLLEAMDCVLEIPLRLKIARHLGVQVNNPLSLLGNVKFMQHFLNSMITCLNKILQ